ncbi:MAG: hypothetical protein NTV86_04515 [Planctomycetota bacterium]|nr:hypothetical protein [Planctomycetota bacterium]
MGRLFDLVGKKNGWKNKPSILAQDDIALLLNLISNRQHYTGADRGIRGFRDEAVVPGASCRALASMAKTVSVARQKT